MGNVNVAARGSDRGLQGVEGTITGTVVETQPIEPFTVVDGSVGAGRVSPVTVHRYGSTRTGHAHESVATSRATGCYGDASGGFISVNNSELGLILRVSRPQGVADRV